MGNRCRWYHSFADQPLPRRGLEPQLFFFFIEIHDGVTTSCHVYTPTNHRCYVFAVRTQFYPWPCFTNNFKVTLLGGTCRKHRDNGGIIRASRTWLMTLSSEGRRGFNSLVLRPIYSSPVYFSIFILFYILTFPVQLRALFLTQVCHLADVFFFHSFFIDVFMSTINVVYIRKIEIKRFLFQKRNLEITKKCKSSTCRARQESGRLSWRFIILRRGLSSLRLMCFFVSAHLIFDAFIQSACCLP